MMRAVVVMLLVAIGCYRWIAAYAVAFALVSWRSLSTLVLDPGQTSPVVVGGAIIVLCAALLFRHVTAWMLTYAALISVPAAAFVGVVAITKPSNVAGQAGAGQHPSPLIEKTQPPPTMPPPMMPSHK